MSESSIEMPVRPTSTATPFLVSTRTGQFVIKRPNESTDPVRVKIRSFARLPSGWHFGAGGPISRHVIDAALAWYNFLTISGIRKIGATPSEDGAVVVAALINNIYTEIISERDKTFTVVRDREFGIVTHKKGLSAGEARDLINKFVGRPWNMSGGFIPEHSIMTSVDLIAKHFATLREETRRSQDFLSLIVGALKTAVAPYANTPLNTTENPRR